MPLLNKKYGIVETNLTEDKAIKRIISNTQIVEKTGFFEYLDVNNATPFYGIINYKSFVIYTTGYKNSHLYMSLNGVVESRNNNAVIKFITKGLSKSFICFMVINYIFITLFLWYTFKHSPSFITIALIMLGLVMLGVGINLIRSKRYKNKAKQDLLELFDVDN